MSWDAPEGCPSPSSASASIAAGLDPASAVRVDVAVVRVGAEYRARVEVRDEGSSQRSTQRTLSSPRCDTVIEGIALITRTFEAEAPVSVPELDAPPTSQQDPSPETPSAAASASSAPEPRAASETAAVPEPVRPPAPTVPVSAVVRAAGVVGWGLTPRIDGGGTVALGLQRARLRLEAHGTIVAPTATGGTVGVRVGGWVAGLRGCGDAWSLPVGRVRLSTPICAALEVGELVGRGQGQALTRVASHRDWVVTAAAGPGLRAQITRRLAAVALVEAAVHPRRPAFGVDGVGEVHRVSMWGVRGQVGLEVRFSRRIRGRRGNP